MNEKLAEWWAWFNHWLNPMSREAYLAMPPSDQLAYVVLGMGRILIVLAVLFWVFMLCFAAYVFVGTLFMRIEEFFSKDLTKGRE